MSVGPRVGLSGFGFATGGGMSLNIGYSSAEGPSLSITGTAGVYATGSVLPMPSLGVQGDASRNASGVDSLPGLFVEGGRTLGRTGVGGFTSPDSVRGVSVTIGLPLPRKSVGGGATAGVSDTSAIIQVDRSGIHIGRHGTESLLRISLPQPLGQRKVPPLQWAD